MAVDADAEPPGASASRSVAPESAHDSGAGVHEVPRVAPVTELPDAAALLSCEQLCTVLANPEQFGLTPGVWLALDAPATLVARSAAPTEAGTRTRSVALEHDRLALEAARTDWTGRVASQVVGGVKDDASGTTERRGDGSR